MDAGKGIAIRDNPCNNKKTNEFLAVTKNLILLHLQEREETPSASSAMTSTAPESNDCTSLQEVQDVDCPAVDCRMQAQGYIVGK